MKWQWQKDGKYQRHKVTIIAPAVDIHSIPYKPSVFYLAFYDSLLTSDINVLLTIHVVAQYTQG